MKAIERIDGFNKFCIIAVKYLLNIAKSFTQRHKKEFNVIFSKYQTCEYFQYFDCVSGNECCGQVWLAHYEGVSLRQFSENGDYYGVFGGDLW